MKLDEFDIIMLKENIDESLIKQLDINNLSKIINYLKQNNVYYYKDLLINAFDLFLLDSSIFIEKFNKLKHELGENFVDKLGDDFSLIEIMYKY